MFSHYKKDTPAKPVNATPKAAAPAPKPAEAAPIDATLRKPMPMARAQAQASDKDRKRKERLQEIKLDLHRELLDNLNLAALEKASENELRTEISAISTEVLEDKAIVLNRQERNQLFQELYNEVTGLGPLETLLQDEGVNDILVNGPQQIFVERSGKLELTDITFKDEKHLQRIIDKIVSAVGRRVDESNPYVDARLADGSRFNAMVPPIAVDGSLVSIRKFKKDKLGIDDLVGFGAFSEEMAAYLQAAVAPRLNVIVSGGTGSGKTPPLNALSSFIDNAERILPIADPHARGHRRTSTANDPRWSYGKPPTECGRQRRSFPTRLFEKRSADASRPHHRRRDPRRRSDRHAAGDEHRSRWLYDHNPRELCARWRKPFGKHDRDGRYRNANQSGPLPDFLGGEPDRSGVTSTGR